MKDTERGLGYSNSELVDYALRTYHHMCVNSEHHDSMFSSNVILLSSKLLGTTQAFSWHSYHSVLPELNTTLRPVYIEAPRYQFPDS